MKTYDIDPKDYLQAKTDSIILHKIILKYPVKDTQKMMRVIEFIAHYNTIASLRELHKNIQDTVTISLITLREYIWYLLEEKIISTIPRYDIKTWNIISGKLRYYFHQTAWRDSVVDYNLSHSLRVQNDIYQYFTKLGNYIYSWKNRGFEFDYLISPSDLSRSLLGQQSSDQLSYFIHVFQWVDKLELKKQVSKMIKIHQLPGHNSVLRALYQKYIVVESIADLSIQKLRYGDLEIIETEGLFRKLEQKK